MIDESVYKDPNGIYPDFEGIPNPIPLKFGTYYRFQLPDVVLVKHTHTDENEHYTIIVSGSFTYQETGQEDRTLTVGDIVDTGKTEHGFISSEPESVLINITKYTTEVEPIFTQVNEWVETLSEKINELRG